MGSWAGLPRVAQPVGLGEGGQNSNPRARSQTRAQRSLLGGSPVVPAVVGQVLGDCPGSPRPWGEQEQPQSPRTHPPSTRSRAVARAQQGRRAGPLPERSHGKVKAQAFAGVCPTPAKPKGMGGYQAPGQLSELGPGCLIPVLCLPQFPCL